MDQWGNLRKLDGCDKHFALLRQGEVVISKIISFGYKHGAPISLESGVVMDVRPHLNKNPYHIPKLKKLTGLSFVVQEYVKSADGFIPLYKTLDRLACMGQGTLWLGCTGGHHRSVVMAEVLGKNLGIPVEHRDIQKR